MQKNMSRIGAWIFFLLGERIALVIIMFLAAFLLATQNSGSISPKAYAGIQDQKANAIEQPSNTPTPIPATPTNSSTPSPTTTPTPTPTSTPTPSPTNTPSPTPSETPTPTPTSVPAGDPNDNAVWDRIAECESHQNWSIDTGNGYFGGLQFSQGAWNSVGGSGSPAAASRDEQIMRGKMLQAVRGWGAWGACAKQLGLN